MDNNSLPHRRQQAGTIPRSPLLLRSKSGAPAISLTELHAFSSKLEQTSMKNRSKSTTKSRANYNNGENVKSSSIMTGCSNNRKTSEKRESVVVKLKQQKSPHTSSSAGGGRGMMRTRTASTSPSAWALSPGRVSPAYSLIPESSPASLRKKSSNGGGGGGGSVIRVLKYFSQKKVSSVKKEEYHRFRVLHNRFLQWRFANARAEAAMAAVQIVAEGKSFSVWLQILKMRNSIVEKRIQMQRLRHEIKLYEIIHPQLLVLHQWIKLEKKNCEAVGRVVRKLSAHSLKLPLMEDAKADVVSIYDAMTTAMEVMDSIEAMITNFETQVEMLKEFFKIVKQEKECAEELMKWITIIVQLQGRERSLQVCLIQEAEELWRRQK